MARDGAGTRDDYAELPVEIQLTMDKYEALGDYRAPEYEEIMFGQIYNKHLCRLDPWPEPFSRTFRHMNNDVYNIMQGPNEFVRAPFAPRQALKGSSAGPSGSCCRCLMAAVSKFEVA